MAEGIANDGGQRGTASGENLADGVEVTRHEPLRRAAAVDLAVKLVQGVGVVQIAFGHRSAAVEIHVRIGAVVHGVER